MGVRPTSDPLAKAGNPRASTFGTIHGRPAKATTWPATSAARARGMSGSRWPLPPAKVKRMRIAISFDDPSVAL
jgi:hypothetical protein